MIGPADIEAWTEEADTNQTASVRETATDRGSAPHLRPRPSAFSFLAPMVASLAMPWRQAFEHRPTRRRIG